MLVQVGACSRGEIQVSVRGALTDCMEVNQIGVVSGALTDCGCVRGESDRRALTDCS